MELVIAGILVLTGVWLGYKMGKGETLQISLKKPAVIIRSDEEAAVHEAYLFNKHSKGVMPLKKDKVNG